MPDEQPTADDVVDESTGNGPRRTLLRRAFVDYKDTFIFWVLDRYGLPLLTLFIVGWVCYHFALWLEPRATQLIDSHIDIVKTAKQLSQESIAIQTENKETNKKTTEILSKMAENTQPLAQINGDHLILTKEIREDVRDLTSDVRDIHRAVVPGTPHPRSSGTPPVTTLRPE